MDIKSVEALVKIFESAQLTELEFSDGKKSIRLSNQLFSGTAAQPALIDPKASPSETAEKTAKPQEEGHKIKSPMVGTMYHAASPTASPFVSIGQKVKKGDSLCIIEAMKMMNHIQADISGEVVAVLADNAQPVEFGQPLFIIKAH